MNTQFLNAQFVEAWPLNSNTKLNKLHEYKCSRCSREKNLPKKFAKEDYLIPS